MTLIVALGAVGACSGKAADSATPAQAAAPAASAMQGAQPAAPAAGAGSQTVTGTVLETMDASSYTYVRVKTDTGELWAAANQFKVAVGDRVVVPLEMPMQNFHSNSLNRDFPLIYFVSRITREGESAMPALAPAHAPMTGGSPHGPAAPINEVVAPAEGGVTVANIWASSASLAGKRVTVRGKVVKYNGGILGRNWLHIQDGTGRASDGSNDITITTDGTAKVGDVITATGTVALNRDFGSGYAYAVILEGAAIVLK